MGLEAVDRLAPLVPRPDGLLIPVSGRSDHGRIHQRACLDGDGLGFPLMGDLIEPDRAETASHQVPAEPVLLRRHSSMLS
jgi:hypothetical protein